MILQLYGSVLTSCINTGPTLGGKCVFTLITSRSYNSLGTLSLEVSIECPLIGSSGEAPSMHDSFHISGVVSPRD